MPICVIFNPTARGDKARRLKRRIDELARQCVLKPTTGPGAACPLAAEAVAEGFDTVVAAGGDGTVNEVINGLAAAPGGLERTRLGVLPLGTINVFAKELNIPEDLDGAWELIRAGQDQRIDLPQVRHTTPSGPRLHHFAQLAGAGLDSRAIALVDWRLKKKIGPLAYVLAGLKALQGTQPAVTAHSEGHSATGELVLIGNGRYYGGRIAMFPKGNPRDGLLDVRVFPRANWLLLLRFGWSWLRQSGFQPHGACSFQTATVTLSSTQPVPFELDGDNVGSLPATFSILPQALRVIGVSSYY